MTNVDAPLVAPDLARVPRLATLAHGIAGAVFAAMYAPNSMSFPAFVAGIAGAVLGVRLARRSLRTPFVVLPGLVFVACSVLLSRFITSSDLVAGVFGPTGTLRLSELVFFPGSVLGVSASLRALSSRARGFVALEVVAFGGVALQLFVDHRFGAINRPFELADPMLATGRDPTLAFMFFGAVVVAVIGLLLLRERSAPRALYHLLVLFGIAAALMVMTTMGKLPSPPPPENGLGLRAGEDGAPPPPQGHGNGRGRGDRPSSGGRGAHTVVAVVVFHDDYASPLETYYFREESFVDFAGPRLSEGIDPDLLAAMPTHNENVAERPPAVAARDLVETTVALLSEHQHPFGLEAPVTYEPLPNPDPSRFVANYRVRSLAPELPYEQLVDSPVGDPNWDAARLARYTQPHPDPRYAQLARQIVEEMLPPERRASPVAQVAAITTWLGREGQYSLHHLTADGPDPASEFLFGERIGFCVHFSHAAVHLMRALGIPSRVVGGYAVPESNRQGGSSLLVTDDLGHAWPEVYVTGEGWMVTDVHPERSLEPPGTPPDPDLARILGELARGEPPPPPDELPQAARVIDAVINAAPVAARAGLWLAIVILALLYVVKVVRRIRPAFSRVDALPRTAYVSIADALAETGIRRARGESREAFAARLAEAIPSLTPLTAQHVAEAFGGIAHRARRPELRHLCLDALREHRRHVPFWRLSLAALDPISFLTSR